MRRIRNWFDRRRHPLAVAASVESEPPIPPTVAGYRVLRTLAQGDRADVLLGHPGADADGPPRALKLFRSSTPREHIDAELVALARAQGPHVVRLVDVSTLRDGRVAAVLERIERDSLGALLRFRGTLGIAEAVTILVPVAQAIDRMHAEGVAHGSISVSTIRFTERGSPTLLSFGVAQLVDPGLPEVRLATIPGVAADRDALASVADAVLGRVGGADAVSAERLLQRVRLAPPAARSSVLVEGLFELSDGAPVSFEIAADPVAGAPLSDPLGELRRENAITRAAVLGAVPDEFVTELLDGRPLRRMADRVRRRAPGGVTTGRRIGVALAAGALTAIVVWMAVPAPQESDALPVPAADAAATGPDASSDPSQVAEGEAVTGDDPRAAVTVLLAARTRCLRDLDAECLSDVDQEGSAVHGSDVEWIRATTAGEDVPDPLAIDSAELGEVQLLGDSAVVQLTGSAPASLLVMRSEAGWRIRELVAVAV